MSDRAAGDGLVGRAPPDPALRTADIVQLPKRIATIAAPWTLAVLTMITFLAAVDRQVFTTLLVPIQKDLHVGDAAMGLLTGSAFSLIYAFIAIPLARLADRANRRNIVAAAVSIWSAATAVCGLVTGFYPLLGARLSVAAAEAANLPATMSMMGDLAPAARRGTPLGIWNAGAALGFAGGGAIAGVLNDAYGWHVAMLVVGLPGLVLGAVMFFTVREPVRGAQDGGVAPAAREPIIPSVLRCARIPSLAFLAIGYVGLNICYTGWLVWVPPFLMRVYHLKATAAGGIFGAIIAGGMLSTLLGAPISDWAAKRAPRFRLYFCVLVVIIAVPLLAASSLVSSLTASIVLMVAYTLISGSLSSVTQATYLSLAPVHLRGLVTALMNVIGAGLGGGLAPVIMGGANDILKQTYGDQSLRYTLLIAPAMMAFCGLMYLVASRTMDRDVGKVTSGGDPAAASS